jgi:hypothetical protein
VPVATVVKLSSLESIAVALPEKRKCMLFEVFNDQGNSPECGGILRQNDRRKTLKSIENIKYQREAWCFHKRNLIMKNLRCGCDFPVEPISQVVQIGRKGWHRLTQFVRHRTQGQPLHVRFQSPFTSPIAVLPPVSLQSL